MGFVWSNLNEGNIVLKDVLTDVRTKTDQVRQKLLPSKTFTWSTIGDYVTLDDLKNTRDGIDFVKDTFVCVGHYATKYNSDLSTHNTTRLSTHNVTYNGSKLATNFTGHDVTVQTTKYNSDDGSNFTSLFTTKNITHNQTVQTSQKVSHKTGYQSAVQSGNYSTQKTGLNNSQNSSVLTGNYSSYLSSQKSVDRNSDNSSYNSAQKSGDRTSNKAPVYTSYKITNYGHMLRNLGGCQSVGYNCTSA